MGAPAPPARLLPPLLLALAGATGATFTVGAWPRVAVVAFGGSVAVNCSRSACPGGNGTLGLVTHLAVATGAGGRRWQSFQLLNVTEWNPGEVTCVGRCGDAESNASAGVLVYRLPERVVLDPVPPVAVGESRNLTCRVVEVAPVGNLTVTLRRGSETLRTESFGAAEGSSSVAVSHLLTAGPGDHGQEVTCHAELSLRPHGPLFARAAVPTSLSVFALPEPPQLLAPTHLEAGAAAPASCRLAGAFPAGNVLFALALAEQPLDVTVTAEGDVLTALTTLPPSAPGQLELTCTTMVAVATRTARMTLHVYRFPGPILELRPESVPVGSEVTVRCHAGDANLTGDVNSSGDTNPTGDASPTRDANPTGDTNPTGDANSTGAANPNGDTNPTGDTNPNGDANPIGDTNTTGDANPTGGAKQTGDIKPNGDANPTRDVNPSGDPNPTGDANSTTIRLQLRDAAGVILAEGPHSQLELRLVARREDDGREFGCQASLTMGDIVVTKDVDTRLSVLYMPEMSPTDCPSNRTWLQGAREALSCHAQGNPAPTVTCARNGVPVSTGVLELVTRSRAGTYSCNATNALGTRSRAVTVRVEHEPVLTERGCPSRRIWVEGERRDLACRADGDPPPSTRCARDGGPSRARGGRVVNRADAGRYVCRATNRHGSATRSVVVIVEYEPSIGESGCPARRLWVEGTPLELPCTAAGNPPPDVTCAKLGDPPRDPTLGGPNVTRAHAGTYQCRASNRRGTALRNVSVTVEYGPAALSLRVVPSANVSRGASFSVECRAEGLPTPTYGWALPVAPNLHFGTDNRTVAVTGAAAANRGLYTCTATNRHGRRAGSVMVHVDESRLALLASLGTLGAVTAVGLAAAGGYYLKTTACKKGEYNVRDAEGSSEAACLHRHRHDRGGEIYGIQLTQP